MNESQFRRKVIRLIEKAGGHVSSVESPASSPGIPDLDFCIDGTEGHIELKIAGNGGLRSTQSMWFKQRLKAGGKPWILIYSVEGVYLIAGEHYRLVISMNQKERVKWETIATQIWPTLPTPQDLAIGLKTNQP